MADEPLVQHPVVRKLEEEAISLYRAKYPDGIPWQELAHETRYVWVAYAENAERNAGVTPCQTEQECEVPALCKETGGCERMEPVCSRGCPSTEVCKAIRSGGECTRGVMASDGGQR